AAGAGIIVRVARHTGAQPALLERVGHAQAGDQQKDGAQSQYGQRYQPLDAMLPPRQPDHCATSISRRSALLSLACRPRYASTISSNDASSTAHGASPAGSWMGVALRTSSVVCRPVWLASMIVCPLAIASTSWRGPISRQCACVISWMSPA